MNHDITHCTGIKDDPKCSECHRRKAHEELKNLVHRGVTGTGVLYSYMDAEVCKANEYNLFWAEEYAGHIHDDTDTIPSRL